MKKIEEQFIVPSLKSKLEAIKKIDDPALKAILQRHLHPEGEATPKPVSLTKKELEDARRHEVRITKSLPPGDL